MVQHRAVQQRELPRQADEHSRLHRHGCDLSPPQPRSASHGLRAIQAITASEVFELQGGTNMQAGWDKGVDQLRKFKRNVTSPLLCALDEGVHTFAVADDALAW